MIKAVKFFAYIDLILGLVLAMPILGTEIILFLHHLLDDKTLVIDNYHAFLMKILGAMVILWAMVRLQHTAAWQIQYDCVARLFVLAFMGYYFYNGLTVLGLFVVVEMLGLYQWRAWEEKV